MLTHLFLTTTQRSLYLYPHFAAEETETDVEYATNPATQATTTEC